MPTGTPSYVGLIPASEATSRIKQRNRGKDTKHELILRRQLWQMGLRFRKNVKWLPGKPDIVFLKARVAIFCDGDFWHGRDWKSLKRSLSAGTNSTYWTAKIASNRKRDALNNVLLERAGWHVIRFWETDITRDPIGAAKLVKRIIASKSRGGTKPQRRANLRRVQASQ